MAEIQIDPATTPANAKTTPTSHVAVTEQPASTSVSVSVSGADDDDPQALEGDARRPERHLAQAIWTIVCGVALPCIPILVVSTVLLVVIFKYRVVPRAGWPDFYVEQAYDGIDNVTDLVYEIRKQGGRPAYYVAYNPSTITTIAGWTSRVVPYLSSSIMALVAFYAARNIVVKSKRGQHELLPTPKQLTILIGLLSGSGWGPLKEAVVHRWGSKERMVAPLPAAFTALALISLLGILIPAFDTWFGVAVHPATITQLTNASGPAHYHAYGRALNASLYPAPLYPPLSLNNTQTFSWPVNIFMPTPHPSGSFLAGSQAAAMLQLDQPSHDVLSNYTGPVPDSAGNKTVYFFGDARSSTALDFRTRTLGLSTQCQVMTTDCYTDSNATDAMAFACPGGFQGDLTYCLPNEWPAANDTYGGGSCTTGIGFARDAQLSQTAGSLNVTDVSGFPSGTLVELLSQNPLYFGTWAVGYPAAGDGANPLFANADQQVFTNGSSNAVWLLNCSATVYDIDYTFVDGALRTLTPTLADGDWAALLSAPFAWAEAALGLQPASLALDDAAFLAGYTAQDAHDLARIWARAFSRAALTLSVGVFAPRRNDLEQLRDNAVAVARVPLVPLYLLLGLKLLYVVVVVVLAVGVYCFTHPAETELVKAQLSVHGLAAAHFNEPDLVRSNVVKEVQSRLDTAAAKNGGSNAGGEKTSSSDRSSSTSSAVVVTEVDPKQQGSLPRAATAPVTSQEQEAAAAAAEGDASDTPKVGLLPTREGTWTFAVLANGAWQSVKPIVQDVVLSQAQAGNLGTAGDVYAAWK